MQETLNLFTQESLSLYEATIEFLNKFGIECDSEYGEPIDVADLYDGPVPKYTKDALEYIKDTFYIGCATDRSLQGLMSDDNLYEIRDTIQHGGKYDGMFIFACEAKPDANLTRSVIAALTRAFNRLACENPVIFVVRQNKYISLATCERMDSKVRGEKLGKVTILRNINCEKTHRGHLNILEALGEKKFSTFDELYKHWMEVFSNELLTKKFYSELSDWYAWAVQVARFPNDLKTKEDDAKFNHESCIRLITRLIFVWFLKQKKLVPEELFDENYIRDNFIDGFDPHDKDNLYYKPSESKYYRLILQNLFFAMLNRSIVAEDKKEPNNRRFRAKVTNDKRNSEYNINNLMRYEQEFMEGGAQKLLHLANTSVPFLNGGLFDCIDDKPNNLYYDGFSERKESLEQLYLPDWLFFGEEVGQCIDLSIWYGDENKRCVSARGIIDILKRYSFTIEENTPLEQEVSLDPELLGKVFENLLAAYNPETQKSARKQTGSFYTPREIVQYMVNESMVAHLKRMCGDELEPEYRNLLSYSTEETTLNKEQRRTVMQAIYNCRVLDPACGSGAFPMGMLQQMVHVLRQLDSTNEMWKDFMIDLAIEQSREAFSYDSEEERKERLADIEEAFNQHVNDPDYARKLYLIEHCIYGVDIQPIAVQISKLRFFISLVVDQKPTSDPTQNFGIRPLPNLESKFVAANTLIPVKYNGQLVETNEYVRKYKNELKELNHRIFMAKRNIDKHRLKEKIKVARQALAQAIENTGFTNHSEAELLAGWDMFDQNASSSYFDAEWMFGVKDGFDVVIANPPYVVVNKESIYLDYYQTALCYELYAYFFEKGIKSLAKKGIISFITASLFIKGLKFESLRIYLQKNTKLINLNVVGDNVFENVQMPTAVFIASKESGDWKFLDMLPGGRILEKMDCSGEKLNSISNIQRGFEIGRNQVHKTGDFKFLTGSNVRRYTYESFSFITNDIFKEFAKDEYYYTGERLLIRETGSFLTVLYLEEKVYSNRSLYSIKIKSSKFIPKYVLGCLNSKACQYYYSSKFKSETDLFPKIRIKQVKMLPIANASMKNQCKIKSIIDNILFLLSKDINSDIFIFEKEIDHMMYHLYNLSYDDVLIIDPNTSITREEYDNYKAE